MTRKQISTSAPRKALPPILVFLIKPLSRIAAAVLGRIGRKWWRKLPDSEKADLRNHLRQNRKLIAGSSIALAILLGSFGYDSVSFFYIFKLFTPFDNEFRILFCTFL